MIFETGLTHTSDQPTLKRAFIWILFVFITITLSACGASGGDEAADDDNVDDSPTDTTPAVDVTAPVITLTGANLLTIENGSVYTEPGATSDDASAVIIDATAVNTAVDGCYIVTYDATDSSGNAAIQVVRSVNVVTSITTFEVNNRETALLGSFDTPDRARDVAITGNFAYVADTAAGLQILDIRNPEKPVQIGGLNTSSATLGITIAGDLAYVADGNAGLQVIDISNPVSPTLAGAVNTPGFARSVTIGGNFAYVDGLSGLRIVDVNDPDRPNLEGSFDTTGDAQDVTIADDLAYVFEDPGK